MTSMLTFSLLYYVKQIDSILPRVCSITDHRSSQNVVRTLVTHSLNGSYGTFLSLFTYLFNHFNHSRETGCGRGRTTDSKLSAPFYPPNHDIPQKTDRNTGNYMPYSLRQVCGFFYVPQDYKH